MKKFLVSIILLLSGMPLAVYGSQPLDELKEPIEKVISILKDPQFKPDDQKTIQREKIREITLKVFDFPEISKRALAQNWRSFTPQQRKEFTDAFTDLLENTYLDKLQGEYQEEIIVFLNQELFTDTKALVKTKAIRQKVEIPIDYSMHLRDGNWWIYDVNVEGVSLVKNYRTQFNKILLKETPDQLIDRLRKKSE